MNEWTSREFRQSVNQSMQDITRRFAGIELTETEQPLSEDTCTIHTVLEGECRADLLLCADTALLIRLARNIMCRDTVTAQDIEDVATEYFNVVCGRIARLIVQPPHSNSRFRIPRFHPGRYLPECDAASRWSIGYNNPENEGMKLIYMGPPSGGNPRS